MHLTIADLPIVPLFLFKLSVSLAVVWIFYQLALRRLTFHSLNRWYLLGYTLFSFIIPFINIGPMLPAGPAGDPVMLQFIPAIGGVVHEAGRVASSSPAAGLSGWAIGMWVLATGAMAMMVRLAVQWISLVRLRRKARLIGGTDIKVYHVDRPIRPFSFGNAIYINQSMHTEKEWADIILHEYVHIRQRHTIDILIAELICIFNWYNPFAWLIRYSIRQNLEFLADQEVLNKGVDRKGYQYHLLKVAGEPDYRLANNFNFSSLRKRIVMMNRMRSTRIQLLKLLFLLPLAAVLLVAFRDQGSKLFRSHGPVYVNAAGIAITSGDRKPLQGVLVRDRTTGLETTTDGNGYYKMQIPASGNPVNIHLDYIKPGYDTDFRIRSIPKPEATIGILDVAIMHRLDRMGPTANPVFIAPSIVKAPVDPEYADAEKELRRALDESDNLNRYLTLQKAHPEIGLFYTTEDRRKEIVIYLDGTVERYGYPGTPGLAELYKKYGEIPQFMATDHPTGHSVNAGYLARWAAISEKAEKEFRPAGDRARAVLFPGDSRVIVLPVSGKPRYYDMDNDDPRERPEFERLYGKLPDCVPDAGNKSHARDLKARDTVPAGRKDTTKFVAPPAVHVHRDSMDVAAKYLGDGPLFFVNGKLAPADTLKSLNANLIKDIHVYKNSSWAVNYGEKAKNGVVSIHMKDWKAPLVLMDGRQVEYDSVLQIDPGKIESLNILKPEAGQATYGEKGKNGVMLITLKAKPSGTGN
ncbi:MAG TPA: M56 family metallopeptidase [Puia sp.]|nr:M56 family metallopeptidase [Puia sp.]